MGKLTFYIARHVADRIRNEPRNIGVVVTDGQHVFARFLGETTPAGALDLRRVPLTVVNDRSLYAEWHKTWRRALGAIAENPPITADGTSAEVADLRFAALLGNAASTFRIEHGGEWYVDADDLRSGDVARVTEEIYRRVVDSTALALTGPNGTATVSPARRAPARSIELAELIATEFRQRNILEEADHAGLFALHPVRVDQLVSGTNPVPHVPKFVQDNGQRWVIEHVDFDVADGELAREHAAYAAYLLSDVQKAPAAQRLRQTAVPLTVVSIAVVNRVARQAAESAAGPEALSLLAAQEYGLAVLAEQRDVRVVHWDDFTDRQRFLDERTEVARGGAH